MIRWRDISNRFFQNSLLADLVYFLLSPSICSYFSQLTPHIGPIHKRDVMRANIMNEKKMPEYATILAFDTTIDAEAKEMAEENNVRIFSADIIYHLFDQFTAYMNGLKEVRKKEAAEVVVFPCVLKILPQHIFNKKDPIVMGVEVLEGMLTYFDVL